MTTGYHNVRWWRLNASEGWQPVGADNRFLNSVCTSVGAGLIPSIQVKCYNGAIVTVRALRPIIAELTQ